MKKYIVPLMACAMVLGALSTGALAAEMSIPSGSGTITLSDVVSTEVKTMTIYDEQTTETIYYVAPGSAIKMDSYCIGTVYTMTSDGNYFGDYGGEYEAGSYTFTAETFQEHSMFSFCVLEGNESVYVMLDGQQGAGAVAAVTPADPAAPDHASPETAPTVAPSPCAVTLDGKAINLNAYLFQEDGGGANYVMLRDIAQLLSGTNAQFEVTWSADQGIVLTTGRAYTPVGSELQGKGGGNKAYVPNASTITIDGKVVELTAYTIEDNNYFKLRDLGRALGFNVSWEEAAGVVIDTNAPYSDAD